METLDLDRTNAFLLKKHHLTEEPKTGNLLEVVRDIGGLHATLATTPYISLFLRLKSFKREDLDDALYTRRLLGKVRYARKTVYILPKERVTVAHGAMKSLLLTRLEVYIQHLGLTRDEYEHLKMTILDIVKGSGKTTKEIKVELKKVELKKNLNVSAIVNLMCDEDLLIRGKPKAGWKSNLHTYFPFDEYFPGLNLSAMDELDAKEQMIRQYVASYGPVSAKDIAWWTGFPMGDVKRILDRLENDIISVEISGISGSHFMLSSDVEFLDALDIPGEPRVLLLPALDSYLMGFKDRQRFLDAARSPWIYDRSGNATKSILVNGQIAGVWDWVDQEEPEVKFYLFKSAGADKKKIINSKAARLGHFIFDKEPRIRECNSMIPLNQRTMGGFMSPLKAC
jgi:hypothetical protein